VFSSELIYGRIGSAWQWMEWPGYLGSPAGEFGHPNRTALIDSAGNPTAGLKPQA
jgi:hypothetical protein